MTNNEILRLENAIKIYGRGQAAVAAVDNVSFSLSAGQLVVLMGPSGSGKTTLLMLMGCLLKPTSGHVYLGDIELSRLSERQLPFIRRKYLGYIFQSFNLFPALSALENVEMVLNLKRITGAKARNQAAELLERVGLSKRLHHLPADLSGGEKQRVAIARALAGDPPILLADEPTGQLDSKTGQLVITILKQVALTENRVVFMVSHDNRILHAADQILWMEDGKLKDKKPDNLGEIP